MARKAEVQQPLPSVLVANYNNVLNLVDEAIQICSEALLQQLVTIKGKPRKDIKPHDLQMITRSLLAIKLVYKMERPILPQPKEPKPARQGMGTYEEWVREATTEAETSEKQ